MSEPRHNCKVTDNMARDYLAQGDSGHFTLFLSRQFELGGSPGDKIHHLDYPASPFISLLNLLCVLHQIIEHLFLHRGQSPIEQ